MKHCRERVEMNNRSTGSQKLSINTHCPINCVVSNIRGKKFLYSDCYIVSYQFEILLEAMREFLQHRDIGTRLILKRFETFSIILHFLPMTYRRSNRQMDKRLILII
jgi:hypothetical protein